MDHGSDKTGIESIFYPDRDPVDHGGLHGCRKNNFRAEV
jgi:hypothetical protein